MKRFAGKVALVTGAASGIGLACAQRLLEEGGRVALVDRAATDVSGFPASYAVGLRADVGNEQEVKTAVSAAAQAFGQIDIVINSAGVIARGTIEETQSEEWRRVLDIDLSSIFYTTKAALPHLRKRGGAIVNVASVAGTRGTINAAYDAAKGGVVALTRQLAGELASAGIRVNSVSPGFTETGLNKKERELGWDARWTSRIPLARFARPEEIAAACAFLASEDASYVIGLDMVVDGGLSSILLPDRQANTRQRRGEAS